MARIFHRVSGHRPLNIALWIGLVCASAHNAALAADVNLLPDVNVFIGTAPGKMSQANQDEGWHAGNTVPGATLPFNMVQFSPDTDYGVKPGLGGYIYKRGVIQGISLIHTNGTGCSVSQDISFMPVISNVTASPATNLTNYQASFSHANEQAVPGFYSVLMNNGVKAELTVTKRTGFGRFSYPNTGNSGMILNVGRNGVGVQSSQLSIIDNNTVEGSVRTGGVCGTGGYTVYFHAEFDQPFTTMGTYQGNTVTPNSRTAPANKDNGGWVHFATGATVKMRVGVSYTSTANAKLNMQTENPNWDFDGIKNAAQATWNTALNRVQASGGSREDRTKFYTSLYRSLHHPNLYSDVNGQYLGFDNKVYTANGWDKYATFSGWDIYRSQVQLLGWLWPKQASDMAQSMIVDAQAGGGGFPKWPMGNDDGCIMPGDSGALIVANMYAFGARNFDTAAALKLMDKAASTPGIKSRGCETRPALSDYLSRGYIPVEVNTWGPIATTLEYAVADAAISQFAGALGDAAKRDLYLRRSQNWKNVFNPATGYIQQRQASGAFSAFRDSDGNGFAEGTPGQYTWMVPHNFRALFDLMGGNSKVIPRLDNHFKELDGGPGSAYAWIANEPEFSAPWAYNFAGAPYKTQALVRRIMNEQFTANPDGLPGNDDLGAMSSWYFWAGLGLYPEIPGVGGFTIGAPTFSNIVVKMGNGRTLTIRGENAGAGGTYIQSLKLNGQSSSKTWVPLSTLNNDATLEFVLGGNANTSWGSAASDAPPSFDAAMPSTGGLVGVESGRCLDVSGASQSDGALVLLWNCSGAANQQWSRQSNNTLQIYGNKCLDLLNGKTEPGSAVGIWGCNGGQNQQWRFNADGSVVNVQSGLCLDVSGQATANGSPVAVWTCNGGANQKWTGLGS